MNSGPLRRDGGPLRRDLAKWQEALDRLPNGSVVADFFGDAWQKSREYWYRAYGDDTEVSSYVLAQCGPGKTLHKGRP